MRKSVRSQKIWKISKYLEDLRKSGRSQKIWTLSENLEDMRKSGRPQKIWKISENLEYIKKSGRSQKVLKIFFKKLEVCMSCMESQAYVHHRPGRQDFIGISRHNFASNAEIKFKYLYGSKMQFKTGESKFFTSKVIDRQKVF